MTVEEIYIMLENELVKIAHWNEILDKAILEEREKHSNNGNGNKPSG